MEFATAFRIASRELRGGIKGFRIFLACLAIGVAAVAAVGSVQTAINRGLSEQGAAILGGDAEIEISYRFAGDAELGWMQENALEISEVVEFRSMAVKESVQPVHALTQLKGVDANYPIYGSVELQPGIELADALSIRDGLPGAILHPVLKERLGLEIGDTFQLGLKEFRFSAVLESEPDSAVSGFGIGPRTIVRTEDLEGTGLLGPGTLYSTKYRLKFPPSASLTELKASAEAELLDYGIRWLDSRNSSPQLRRFIARIGAFLVLVGLAGLAVGGVGVAAAVRLFLEGKTETIGTLKTIGASQRTIFRVYLMQTGAMMVLGTALGLLIGAAAPLLLAPLISGILPLPAVFGIYPEPLAKAAIYGLLTGLVFSLWSLARTADIPAAVLFRGIADTARRIPSLPYLVAVAVLLSILVGVASWFSGVPRLALWTAAGLFGALVVLSLAAMLVRNLARKLSRSGLLRGRTLVRLAFGSVGGPGGETASVVLSLGLGLTVLAAVGQISTNLRNAIARDLPVEAPSYFVVDIQGDQLDPLLDRLKSNQAVERIETAPMLRGFITRINGRPAREVAGSHWVVSGDRGVTYAASPPEGTVVTRGEWWPEDYTGPPLVSFAEEEAVEIGLDLGDQISVNILGREIEATIASLRVVDFSTAGIGFIMAMNPSALAGAPHTHIATVYSEQSADSEVFKQITEGNPNITAISVTEGIQRATEILTGLVAAITYSTGAALLTGFVVLIGAAAAGEKARVFESAVLKTLGASRVRILISLALRSAILGAAAGVVAIFAGAAAGWAVMRFVMEVDYTFEPVSAVAIVSGGTLLTIVAGLLFAIGPLNAKPARVLRARE